MNLTILTNADIVTSDVLNQVYLNQLFEWLTDLAPFPFSFQASLWNMLVTAEMISPMSPAPHLRICFQFQVHVAFQPP